MIGIIGNFFKEGVEWRGLKTETIIFKTFISSSSWNAFSPETYIPIFHTLTYFTLLSQWGFPTLWHFLNPCDIFLSWILIVSCWILNFSCCIMFICIHLYCIIYLCLSVLATRIQAFYGRDFCLFGSFLYPQHPAEGLAQSIFPINICSASEWTNEFWVLLLGGRKCLHYWKIEERGMGQAGCCVWFGGEDDIRRSEVSR